MHNVGPLSEMLEKVLRYITPYVFAQSFYEITLNWPKLKKKPSAAVLKYKLRWWGSYIIAQRGRKLSDKHHGSSFSCTDHEYLVKSGGSVHLHSAKTGQSSEFLTSDKFVSLLPHNTRCQRTDYTQTHALSSRVAVSTTTDYFFFPVQDERNASDYHLSADRKYVAFMSNYVKVCWTCIHIFSKAKKAESDSHFFFFVFVFLAVEAFLYGNIFIVRSGIKVSTKKQFHRPRAHAIRNYFGAYKQLNFWYYNPLQLKASIKLLHAEQMLMFWMKIICKAVAERVIFEGHKCFSGFFVLFCFFHLIAEHFWQPTFLMRFSILPGLLKGINW